MGRRHFTKPFHILEDADISVAVTGDWTSVTQYDAIKYFVGWTGDADGELKVETTDDIRDGEVFELDFGTTINIDPAENPKQHQILINSVGHQYVRLKYVPTSGSGTMNATMAMTSKGA